MYTIIFSEENDFSTNDVIEWLEYYNQKVIRTDFDSLLNTEFNVKISENGNDFSCIINNKRVTRLNLKSLWYRRTVPFILDKYVKNNTVVTEFETGVLQNLFNELKYAKNSFYNATFKDKKWLNNPLNSVIDKTECLFAAQSVGLLIPETIITNKKSELKSFFVKNKDVIIKPIYNVSRLSVQKYSYLQYTYRLDKKKLNSLSESIFPSLCQKMIKKDFELRIFFLEGKFYSMAMFTQNKKKTKIDFRRYDYIDPNRTVPYKLPKELEDKLNKLMNIVGLNCGSIDIIKDVNGLYYFLEINPVGQFGMTSSPCNYYLEKKVAKFLIE